MPRFRPDLDGLVSYLPGRPIEEVAREVGIEPAGIIKLASNESPFGPFPGVGEAVAAAMGESNRYPDNDGYLLTQALANHLGVGEEFLWLGAGSTGLLGSIAYGLGGAGTSALYAWPSFVMYRIISRWSMTEPIEVRLDADYKHELSAMLAAVRADTSVIYLCNPNNPTGTVVGGEDVTRFVDSVPDSVVVVVDEAYHHFVSDPDYRSALPMAMERPNVVVLRTLSKVFALAAHRVGFAVGMPETLNALRRTQAPFTVNTAAQVAATTTLLQADEVEKRIAANAEGREVVTAALADRAILHAHSETNFVFLKIGDDSNATARQFLQRGIIIRPMSGGWIRVTVGTPVETAAFVDALDQIPRNR
ncbi:MAG TPA: histidinol-phosphate transaminase [Acidimicrobiia bacterium]